MGPWNSATFAVVSVAVNVPFTGIPCPGASTICPTLLLLPPLVTSNSVVLTVDTVDGGLGASRCCRCRYLTHHRDPKQGPPSPAPSRQLHEHRAHHHSSESHCRLLLDAPHLGDSAPGTARDGMNCRHALPNASAHPVRSARSSWAFRIIRRALRQHAPPSTCSSVSNAARQVGSKKGATTTPERLPSGSAT